MLKHFTLAIALAAASSALAQPCTPNPLYAYSIFGVWPDTIDNFMPGQLGIPYSQDLNLIVPPDAQDIDPTFPNVQIDSIVLNGVAGLPAGLSVACASQTPGPCTYLPSQLGCGVISGTPSEPGFFPLDVNVTGYFTLFGNVVPYPLTFTGYHIFVLDPTSVADAGPVGLASVRNVPNPFTTRTQVEFQLARGGLVNLSVFDLLGAQVDAISAIGRPGLNRIAFERSDLQEGVYLYKVEAGGEVFTGRMMLNR